MWTAVIGWSVRFGIVFNVSVWRWFFAHRRMVGEEKGVVVHLEEVGCAVVCVKKCQVGKCQSKGGSDGLGRLYTPMTGLCGRLRVIRALLTTPITTRHHPRPSQATTGHIPDHPTSNPNSTGAFGIIRWPKMRKIPYKKKFFAFLVFFLNSGFYMIV